MTCFLPSFKLKSFIAKIKFVSGIILQRRFFFVYSMLLVNMRFQLLRLSLWRNSETCTLFRSYFHFFSNMIWNLVFWSMGLGTIFYFMYCTVYSDCFALKWVDSWQLVKPYAIFSSYMSEYLYMCMHCIFFPCKAKKV